MSGTEQQSRVGAQFGPYRLMRLIGRGGMGEVYEAEDTAKGRIVALKLLPPALSHDQQFRKRLLQEAQIAGRLHEPHVVPVHGCDEIEGQLYVDMRLIDGTDLRKILDRTGPLPPARAVAIVRQIAAALDAAHGAGTMHRDVKPENILISDDDFACLLDFGIAKAAAEEKLTQDGGVVGTLAYMAPERFTDADVTYRVDIYSLACVLFECLTGSAPYQGSTANLMHAHVYRPVPRPSAQRNGVPVAFDQVIADGMAKEPEDRYASAGELARSAAQALSAAEHEQPAGISRPSQAVTVGGESGFAAQSVPAPPPSGLPFSGPVPAPQFVGPRQPSPRNPWKFLAAAAIAVAAILGGLGIWLGTRSPQPPEAQRSQPAPPSNGPTTSKANGNSDTEFLAALSKDNFVITDAAKTVANAHVACMKLSSGVPFGTVVQQIASAQPSTSASQAQYFVFESVEIYCPENRGLVVQ